MTATSPSRAGCATAAALAARTVHHARRIWLHLDRAGPWTDELLKAHQQLDRLAAATA